MHVFSTSALYMVFSIPLSSLYCNAFLANLNVRSYVRGEGTTHKFNAGAEMVVMDRTASNDTTTAKQSMRFSSAIHLVSIFRIRISLDHREHGGRLPL